MTLQHLIYKQYKQNYPISLRTEPLYENSGFEAHAMSRFGSNDLFPPKITFGVSFSFSIFQVLGGENLTRKRHFLGH